MAEDHWWLGCKFWSVGGWPNLYRFILKSGTFCLRYLSDMNDWVQCTVGVRGQGGAGPSLHRRVAKEGPAMQCTSMQAMQGTWSEVREVKVCPLQKKVWNPIAWCPKKAKLANWDVGGFVFLLFTAYYGPSRRMLTKDGWTLCRNLADQILLILLENKLLKLLTGGLLNQQCWLLIGVWMIFLRLPFGKIWAMLERKHIFSDVFPYPNNVHLWHCYDLSAVITSIMCQPPEERKNFVMLIQLLPTSI